MTTLMSLQFLDVCLIIKKKNIHVYKKRKCVNRPQREGEYFYIICRYSFLSRSERERRKEKGRQLFFFSSVVDIVLEVVEG